MTYDNLSFASFSTTSKIKIEDVKKIRENEKGKEENDPQSDKPGKRKGRKILQPIFSIKPKEMEKQVPQKENPEKFHNIYVPNKWDIEEYEESIKKRAIVRVKRDFYVGDTVKVVKGDEKDLNKIGVVKQITSDGKKVKVTGVNLKELFNEPEKAYKKFKTEKAFPKKYFPDYFDINNIMLISPHTNDVCKPIFSTLKDKTVKRLCPKTNFVIPIPEKKIANNAQKHVNYRYSILDTSEKDVRTVTYKGPEYDKVARAFLDMIKEKKNIEEKLILKDKMIKDIKL
jgi:ribosomal protein L24